MDHVRTPDLNRCWGLVTRSNDICWVQGGGRGKRCWGPIEARSPKSIQHAKARVQKVFLNHVKVCTRDLQGQPADETLTWFRKA